MRGRYELVELLGSGAAGDVYRARDRVWHGREVALKRIRARVDDALREAFEREFSTMASLSLPGVAAVYDFGVMEGEQGEPARPFYTRAFIAGRPLDLAAEGCATDQRVGLFVRVARVVGLLHRAGVVHGDIKPGNAIIDAAGEAHVIDFGLARAAGVARSAAGSAGTPPFMAPELLDGDRPSIASDVFALGVTLWVLLKGEFPFGTAATRPRKSEPPPVAAQAQDLDSRLLAVARRALSADPLDRLPTVDELVAMVEQVCPRLRDEGARKVFVPPRPRGHHEALLRVEAQLDAAQRTPQSDSVLLLSPRGGGKSSLLRELKWRLQLRAAQVIDVAPEGVGLALQLDSLLSQLSARLPTTDPGKRALQRARGSLSGGRLDETELSDALSHALRALGERDQVVVLVDDLDRAEAAYGAILRSAMFADNARKVTVVATAKRAAAPAVRALNAGRRIELPALSEQDVKALAVDVLGAVDASVLDALCARAGGLPGPLIDALSLLWALPAPTAADIEALPPAGASIARARAQLDGGGTAALPLLGLFVLLGRVQSQSWLPRAATLLQTSEAEVARLLGACERASLLSPRAEGLGLSQAVLEQAVRERLGEQRLSELARALLADQALVEGLPLAEVARLSVAAQAWDEVARLSPLAVEQLLQGGAPAAAADLCEAWLSAASDADRGPALLSLARARQALGEYERAAQLAAEALGQGGLGGERRAEAAVLAARALSALGRLDDAVEQLSAVPQEAGAGAQARRFHELSKVHLRRGDYEAVADAADRGLEVAPADDPVRAELLCSRGMAASYRAQSGAARGYLEEALSVSRRLGSLRDEANALAYLAIDDFRSGDALSARDLFSQCLEIARGARDVGSMANYSLNLGAMLFYLGEPQAAAEHYESAARLSRRAGRASTELFARNNRAHVHIYFGLYERARAEVESVLGDARAAGQKYNEAQAIVLLGDLHARAEDVDQALIRYDDAISRYSALGQTREVADHHLDAAEALLDRAGPADASAAAARLSAARGPIEDEAIEDLKLRLSLLLARARVQSGDAEAALPVLEEVTERARKGHNRDVEWSALSATARAHEQLGADFAARRFARLAVEVLEDIALRIPREHREAFWHDPRRRAVRAHALSLDASVHGSASVHGGPASEGVRTLLGDPRAERLLEIIKRLAGEHDLDRLLERITESAVDLSGAERGYVLLVDRGGQLEKRTVQVSKAGKPDPHEAFSRSIAEAVLIDGEPIVTVDATDDGRLSEFVSVHKLMLRSVACLPIRGPSATVGVLYLEHRRSRGRFSDSAVDLLHAFADQAAIALENARLLAENQQRRQELEQANQQLEQAKLELEELLHARTEELAEARRELKHTRRSRRDAAMRHGMIGQSPAMRRVFDTIERLQGVRVPVVIHGESGTGKELVARAIHYGGERARAPFVALNCGSVPESLLESELFGHVKGAFSGADREREGMIARASAGTLFLDEVGDMPAKMQVDLLRVLQEGTVCKVGGEHEERVDVRVLAASNRRLDRLVEQGAFREDLYYRLTVVELCLPPLRERTEDIPLLCQYLLSSFAERDSLAEKRLSREALAAIMGHPLPGNVRQLEHMLLQAWVMVEGSTIEVRDLPIEQSLSQPPPGALEAEHAEPSPPPPPSQPAQNVGDHREQERQRILQALQVHSWNRARAAQSLGIPRRTFYRRLREYGILEADAG